MSDMTTETKTSLDKLRQGQKGKVLAVAGYGAIRRRLYDLGLHAGEVITMVKTAPLKDPLEISFGNGHVSIRRSEAALITVEPLPD
ncbi:MAG: ferrous iron transport protein A [candidate division Zixibacteria bacterium]|nr:ferrous iron transport protein A [candidate division Zixibacteria bacterium]